MVTLILSRFTRSLILLFLLTGCMTTPISSIPKLMRLDFLTMNFEHVRVGLQLPAHLSLGSGDAVMIIRSVTDGVKGETVETFALIEIRTPPPARSSTRKSGREPPQACGE